MIFVRDNKKRTNITISKSYLKRKFNFEYLFAITAVRFLKKKKREIILLNTLTQIINIFLKYQFHPTKQYYFIYFPILQRKHIPSIISPYQTLQFHGNPLQRRDSPISQYCFFIIILNNSPPDPTKYESNQRQQNLPHCVVKKSKEA